MALSRAQIKSLHNVHTMTNSTKLRLDRTLRFEVIGTDDEKQDAVTTSKTNLRLHRTLRFEVMGTEDEKQDAVTTSEKAIHDRIQPPQSPFDKKLETNTLSPGRYSDFSNQSGRY